MKLFSKPKVGTADAQLITRNLSVALKAGVPLAKALQTFSKDAPKKHKVLMLHLQSSVEKGHSLADAMESAPRRFPHIAINLVRVGEMSGSLAENLAAIANHLGKTQELKRKIRSAMMYPTFVLVAVVGLGLSIGTLVLPKLTPLFETLDVDLPWTTRALLAVAQFLEVHGIQMIALTLLLLLLAFLVTRLEAVKPYWHRTLLAIPYVGVVLKQATVAQIAFSLEILLRSGIPIRDAIPAAARSIENRSFRNALLATIPVIESGRSFADGIEGASDIFPMMSRALLSVGEETGTMTDTLAYLSEYFNTEVEYAVKNLTNALEPILLISVGLLVGGVVMAIITPIYDVTSSIR